MSHSNHKQCAILLLRLTMDVTPKKSTFQSFQGSCGSSSVCCQQITPNCHFSLPSMIAPQFRDRAFFTDLSIFVYSCVYRACLRGVCHDISWRFSESFKGLFLIHGLNRQPTVSIFSPRKVLYCLRIFSYENVKHVSDSWLACSN